MCALAKQSPFNHGMPDPRICRWRTHPGRSRGLLRIIKCTCLMQGGQESEGVAYREGKSDTPCQRIKMNFTGKRLPGTCSLPVYLVGVVSKSPPIPTKYTGKLQVPGKRLPVKFILIRWQGVSLFPSL